MHSYVRQNTTYYTQYVSAYLKIPVYTGNFLYSWDEMGKYDIPAMIDQILDKTGQQKIFYIGHSMGTTGFMVMANDKPEYQEHIHLANFLAPVAYVDHMKSPIRYLAPFVHSIEVKPI